jgi:mannose-6-phosphate isomerase
MDMKAMEASVHAEKLATRHVAKPWGKADLPPPFVNPGADKIGEIWFEAEGGPPLELMVKYLFTSEKLSIQVHPSDAQARAMGLAGGKEECWLVLDAEPGARLGIGTRRALSSDELRAAAIDGSIEDLIDWKPVQRGDFFYIPAGTVHAIGAGVCLIEIQQNADITYRLYDYGRPRELHLDDGVAVSSAVPYTHAGQRQIDFAADQTLVDGPLFAVRLTGDATERLPGSGPLIVVPVEGQVSTQTGDTRLTVEAGECLAIDPDASFEASSGARLLLARAR